MESFDDTIIDDLFLRAIFTGNVRVLKILCEFWSLMNCQESAWECAIEYNHAQVLEYLLDYTQEYFNKELFTQLLAKGSLALAEVFIRKMRTAVPAHENPESFCSAWLGQRLLELCAQDNAQKEIVAFLLKNRASCTVTDAQKNTALHFAAYSNPQVASLMIPHSSLFAQNYRGRTALHYAAEGRSVAVILALQEAGLTDTIRDIEGHTALSIAQRNRYIDVIDCLTKKK